ncbi:hypothetical protein [Pseudothioclava nitratireducens]|jgi:hypothetical protein|uniref:hypothetical protein n=1 Tax=Pseudothioclava nitratireducens TaxID=1928646 RepID=UPI0023DA14B8|nr:hypothetical protein [Defluviimonas nitratireducens]MDF1621756.1 hypothetical protein [Defluviimonas nitratireducens]
MLRNILPTLALLVASSATAQEKNMTWKALEGDRLNLNGMIINVHGISCPPPILASGMSAKRLANTFLRGGVVVCATSLTEDGSEFVDCAKQGNNGLTLSQKLVFSDLCIPLRDQECLPPFIDALPTYALPPPRPRDG